MSIIICIIISLLTLILTVVGIGYTRRNIKEKQKLKEEVRKENEIKVQECVHAINADYKEKLIFLDNSLLHKEHYFTYSEKEKFIDSVKDLLEQIEFIKSKGSKIQLNADINRLYEAVKNMF